MPAMILDGRKISAEIREELKNEAKLLKEKKGIVPGLAGVLVGEDPGSKFDKAKELGIKILTEEEFKKMVG
jgi:5,10-methylene-tetrahydrofolate dehydrogenase/methenyl tetrahydrofolate cyclohydrolase